MALETTPDKPVPVRVVSQLIGEWIARLGEVWVEGQIAQLTRRPGARMVFLTLRDPDEDVSLSVTAFPGQLDKIDPPLADGAAVVIQAKPRWYAARGQLSLAAGEIRPVGIGALLARLEQLKQELLSEGLFASERKQPLPFMPRTIGLICGRASAAEKDVVENAQRRWPAARFAIRNVVVQGPNAVGEVCAALAELDAEPGVEVIVITRGGGSVEDLLPFSHERLIRAVAQARTPVVSAIGHEVDTPLLDLVADLRASTPTDAAKRVVPDVVAEQEKLAQARTRMRRCLTDRLAREGAALAHLRARPVLRSPLGAVAQRLQELAEQRQRLRAAITRPCEHRLTELQHLSARLRALSPQATLDRGYAVVRHPDGAVVTASGQVTAGNLLTVRVAEGSFGVTVSE